MSKPSSSLESSTLRPVKASTITIIISDAIMDHTKTDAKPIN